MLVALNLGGAGIELGGGLLNERIVLSAQPWVSIRHSVAEISIGPKLNFDLRDGQLRQQDWDEPGDYGLIVHKFSWGKWLRGGAIAHKSFGHGTLVNRYHNRVDRDHGRLGIELKILAETHISWRPNRYELMVDQVLDRPVMAGGFGWWSTHGELNLIYAADHGAPTQIESDVQSDGWLKHSPHSRWALSLSSRWQLIPRGGQTELALIGDINSIRTKGWGIHSGLELAFQDRDDWRVQIRFLGMRSGRDYTWSLFDTSYLIDRWRGIESELENAEAVWGLQGLFQLTVQNALIIGLEYTDVEQADRTDFGAWMRVPLDRFTLGAFWKVRRVNGFVEIFDWNDLLAAVSGRYRVNDWFTVTSVLSRDWFIDRDFATYAPNTTLLLMAGFDWANQR